MDDCINRLHLFLRLIDLFQHLILSIFFSVFLSSCFCALPLLHQKTKIPPRKKGIFTVSTTAWEERGIEKQQARERRREELAADQRETIATLSRACKLCVLIDKRDKRGRAAE